MTTINVDITNIGGKIKPMNAVNNGPAGSVVRGTGNATAYAEACIPYARYHDSAAYSGYGGEYSVDVHRIFRNFDADENDPASYTFGPTDNYVKSTIDAGTKVFYRLGSMIEHGYKFGTYPPKDFAKWARICEHIIRHYNEGWADGFEYGIEYWEIWNEPDCRNADGSNPCWQGTDEQFIEFYEVAAKHLKKCFPNLKIGGPAFMSVWRDGNDIRRSFLRAVKERNIPLDFYSYHSYGPTPMGVYEAVLEGEKALAEAGLDGTPTILNEWNYVRGWIGDVWKYSLRSGKLLKGSSFIAGAMSLCQASSLYMLMYYDARPCGMNGIFDTDTLAPLKGYYTYIMFKDLVKLGDWVKTDALKEDIYTCAATDGKDSAVMLTYFNDNDNSPSKRVKVEFENVKSENGVRVEYRLLDKEHNLELVREEIFTSDKFSTYLDMDLFSSYLINIVAL